MQERRHQCGHVALRAENFKLPSLFMAPQNRFEMEGLLPALFRPKRSLYCAFLIQYSWV